MTETPTIFTRIQADSAYQALPYEEKRQVLTDVWDGLAKADFWRLPTDQQSQVRGQFLDDMLGETPPPVDRTFVGGLAEGVRGGVQALDVGQQLVRGLTPDIPPAPRPAHNPWAGKGIPERLLDPHWWTTFMGDDIPHFAGQALGGSMPVMAGTLAGAGAGSAVPGFGTLGGGIAGAGGTAALQALGNEYTQAIHRGLDHDEALDKALAGAGVSGTINALAVAVPGLGRLGLAALRPLMSTALREAGIQVGLGMADEAGTALAAGRDVDPKEVVLSGVAEGLFEAPPKVYAGAKGASRWMAHKARQTLSQTQPDTPLALPAVPLEARPQAPSQAMALREPAIDLPADLAQAKDTVAQAKAQLDEHRLLTAEAGTSQQQREAETQAAQEREARLVQERQAIPVTQEGLDKLLAAAKGKTRASSLQAVVPESGDAQAARMVADALGAQVVFFQADQSAGFNGAFMDGVIYLNVDSNNHLAAVLGHELGHRLKATDPRGYQELLDLVGKDPEAVKEFTRRRQELDMMDAGASANEEFIGDLLGQHIYDTQFWGRLQQSNPGLVQKLRDLIQRIVDGLRTRPELHEDYRVRQLLDDMSEIDAALEDVLQAQVQPMGRPPAVRRLSVNQLLQRTGLDPTEIQRIKDRIGLVKPGVAQRLGKIGQAGNTNTMETALAELMTDGEAATVLRRAGVETADDLAAVLTSGEATVQHPVDENAAAELAFRERPPTDEPAGALEGDDTVPFQPQSNAEYVKAVQAQKRPRRRSHVEDTARRAAADVLVPLSTEVEKISPELVHDRQHGLRGFEYRLAQQKRKGIEAATPFLQGLQDLQKANEADWLILDRALKNGEKATIDALTSKHGLAEAYQAATQVIEATRQRAEAVGYEFGRIPHYWPRVVRDHAGMLETVFNRPERGRIDQAIKEAEERKGRTLDADERAQIADTELRGYPQGTDLGKPGHLKSRTIGQIDSDLNPYYLDSGAALMAYLERMNNAIEARRFFGKGRRIQAESVGEAPDMSQVDEDIGYYVQDQMAAGRIQSSDQDRLVTLLRARFGYRPMAGWLGNLRDATYLGTMGNPISAITQIGDMVGALYLGGVGTGLKAYGRAMRGKSRFTVERLGIEPLGEEFTDGRKLSRALDQVFKAVQITRIDRWGKQATMDAYMNALARRAQQNKLTERDRRRISEALGPRADQAIQDLAGGRWSEDIDFLAYDRLSDIQPISRSEVPRAYLANRHTRLFYQLKTFFLRRFDFIRREAVNDMRHGQTKAQKIQGLKNLTRLAVIIVLAEGTADAIKDLILGRDMELDDYVVNNLLKLVGISKFHAYTFRRGGPESFVGSLVKPAAMGLAQDAYRDVSDLSKDHFTIRDMRTWGRFPFGGKLYYWWWGGGEISNLKSRRRRITDERRALKDLPVDAPGRSQRRSAYNQRRRQFNRTIRDNPRYKERLTPIR